MKTTHKNIILFLFYRRSVSNHLKTIKLREIIHFAFPTRNGNGYKVYDDTGKKTKS